ncbi:MAG: hypothetical protein IJD10_03995, partial [Clostridia bacterium]|nr:hypothetical protein [Clostridia bacterium]
FFLQLLSVGTPTEDGWYLNNAVCFFGIGRRGGYFLFVVTVLHGRTWLLEIERKEVFLPLFFAQNGVLGCSKFLKGQGKLFSKSFPCYRSFFPKPPLALLFQKVFLAIGGVPKKEAAELCSAAAKRCVNVL